MSTYKTTLSYMFLFTNLVINTYGQDFDWVRTNGPYGGRIHSMERHPTNSSIIFIGTPIVEGKAGFFMSQDNGQNWVPKVTGLDPEHFVVQSIAIDPQSPNIMYLGTWRKFYKTTDGGETWFITSNGLPEQLFYDIAIDPQNTNVLFVAINSYGVFKSTDSGNSWTLVLPGYPDFVKVNAQNPSIVYAEGNRGIYKSVDGGISWNPSGFNSQNDPGVLSLAIDPNSSNVMILGVFSGIYRSSDGGQTWNHIGIYDGATEIEVYPSNPTTFYAGSFYKHEGLSLSTDGGITWAQIAYKGGSVLCLLRGLNSPDELFVGTNGGGIFNTTNGGVSWNRLPFGGSISSSIVVHPSSSSIVFAGCVGAGIQQTNDGGMSWTALQNGIPLYHNVSSISFDPNDPNIMYAAGNTSGGPTQGVFVYKSIDAGQSWFKIIQGLPTSAVCYGCEEVIPMTSSLIYLIYDNRIYKSINSGDFWIESSSGIPEGVARVNTLTFSPSNPLILYAGLNQSTPPIDGIYKSIDGGQTWLPNGLINVSVKTLVVDPINANLVYAGAIGQNPGIYKSIDGGDNWFWSFFVSQCDQVVYPYVLSMVLDPNNSSRLHVGTSQNILVTHNSAVSWSCIADFGLGSNTASSTGMAISKSQPQKLYAGVPDLGIFRLDTSGPMPDLTSIRVGGQWRADLRFEPSTLGDDWVRVTATIRNIGNAPATGVEVAMYDGDPSNPDNRIPATLFIPEIPPDDSGTVSVDWQAGETGGKNGIFVVVDPQNSIGEADEENNTAEYYRRPIILIPGIIGSPLYESENDPILSSERVWVKAGPGFGWDFLGKLGDLPAVNDGLSRLLLNNDGTSINQIKIGPSEQGMIEEIQRIPIIDVFENLVAALGEGPYELYDGISSPFKSTNVFLFLYDWRLGGDNASTALAELIDNVKDWTDSEAVDLICHSMGGSVAKHAIQREKINRSEVDHLFFFGTPHLGAPKAFYAFQTGRFNFFLRPSLIKDLVRFSSGSMQLIPSQSYFDVSGSYVFQYEMEADQSAILLLPLDYMETRALVRLPVNEIPYDLAENFVEDISNVNLNEIRIINVVGIGKSTIVRVQEDLFDWNLDGWDARSERVGDGTVPRWSAEFVNADHNFADHYLEDVKHEDLPSHPQSIEWIKDYFYWYERQPASTATSRSSVSAKLSNANDKDVSQIEFYILPGNMASRFGTTAENTKSAAREEFVSEYIVRVLNSQGRETKLTSEYEIVEDIPGSILETYGMPGDTIGIFIALPASDTYQISHHANDVMQTNGIRLQQSWLEDADRQLTYNNLDIAPGGNAQFEISPILEQMNLSVDRDGDNVFEAEVEPSFFRGMKEVEFAIPGWYMFSPPVDLSVTDAVSIMDNISNGIVFAWDGANYSAADTLRMGQGYWLLILAPQSPTFFGALRDSIVQHFTPGWHMIGPLSRTVDFSSPNDNPDGSIFATFGWNAETQSYFATMVLEPGKAYWIATLQECDLTIGAGAAVVSAKATHAMSWQEFAAKFGELPPLPPNQFSHEQPPRIPTAFGLSQNYPNPFNPETVIEYQLPEAGRVSLKIYNLLGREVRILVDQDMPAGYHRVRWDGRDAAGRKVDSGVYLYQIHVGNFMQTRKTLLLK